MSNELVWWGTAEVPIGQVRRWRIGPARLLVERAEGEWRMVHDVDADDDDSAAVSNEPMEAESLLHHANVTRFGVSDDDVQIHLSPRTADRAVVTRPVSSYSVAPGENISVWVGSPLWIAVHVGRERRLVLDVPIVPASNTWFGQSPAEGELCYASRSVFRARLSNLQLRAHRAITPLRLDNQSDVPLALERINVPVPYLPLFASKTGVLWTPEVTLVHRDDEAMAPLQIGEHAPAGAEGATRTADPRRRVSEHMLVRAFSSLFSL